MRGICKMNFPIADGFVGAGKAADDVVIATRRGKHAHTTQHVHSRPSIEPKKDLPSFPPFFTFYKAMPFNTFTVACSTTPTAISTFFNHYTTPKQKKSAHPAQKQLSYHEGVNLVRQFLSTPLAPFSAKLTMRTRKSSPRRRHTAVYNRLYPLSLMGASRRPHNPAK